MVLIVVGCGWVLAGFGWFRLAVVDLFWVVLVDFGYLCISGMALRNTFPRGVEMSAARRLPKATDLH